MEQVTIYGTSHCTKCVMVKQLLEAKAIPFKFVNLDDYPDVLEEVTAKIWPRTSLPIIQVDTKYYCPDGPQEVLTLINSEG